MLRSQLRHLQHHLSLCKLHAKYANDAEEGRHLMGNSFLLSERRKALVASHSTSIRGPHAQEYRTLLMEHIRLEDQFRQVTAARVAARYRLQKLIIETIHPPNNMTSLAVSRFYQGPFFLANSTLGPSFRECPNSSLSSPSGICRECYSLEGPHRSGG